MKFIGQSRIYYYTQLLPWRVYKYGSVGWSIQLIIVTMNLIQTQKRLMTKLIVMCSLISCIQLQMLVLARPEAGGNKDDAFYRFG
ncbi:unnamed protein product [Schistosoma turkestanicum]|nr:unnamed protein product [Schistosoma turkestanicum]